MQSFEKHCSLLENDLVELDKSSHLQNKIINDFREINSHTNILDHYKFEKN